MAENIIKNPARNSSTEDTAEHSSYVPQYRILGISPEVVNLQDKKTEDISEKNRIPNVGNDMEHSWTQSPQENIISEPLTKNKEKYILLAGEELILVGSLQTIEEEVRKIFYKEHSIEKYNNLDINDLVVLKKMKIKIGVFVE
jgi:hypothetical protein